MQRRKFLRSAGVGGAVVVSAALALPAVPALQSPASIVVPMGWYRPKRVIELYSDNSRQVLLSAVLERGSDFERVAFEAA